MARAVYFCIFKVHAKSFFFFLNALQLDFIDCVVHLDILGTLMGVFLVTKMKFLKENFWGVGGVGILLEKGWAGGMAVWVKRLYFLKLKFQRRKTGRNRN